MRCTRRLFSTVPGSPITQQPSSSPAAAIGLIQVVSGHVLDPTGKTISTEDSETIQQRHDVNRKQDRALQSSFKFTSRSGLRHRISRLKEACSTTEGRAVLNTYLQRGVLSNQSVTSGLASLKSYCELGNPLLQKYNFDPIEFVTGAREAFVQTQRAISSPDFHHYINKTTHSSSSNDLLRSVLHPRLYWACGKASEEMERRGTLTFVDKIEVTDTCIVKVKTDIIDEAPSLKVLVGDRPHTHAEAGVAAFTAKRYPAGSVIATIDVLVEATEEHVTPCEDGDSIRESRVTLTQWVSCAHVATFARFDDFSGGTHERARPQIDEICISRPI
jgi:hypothetical protein